MSRFAGKVVVITGGGSGAGKATAAMFLKEGAKVVIAGRDAEKLGKASSELRGGADLAHHATDVTKPEQCHALIAFTTKMYGRVDILVNNAGMNIKERTFREITLHAWEEMVRANLDGAFYMTKAVLNQMIERKDGVVINIVSVAGKRANPLGGVAYVAAKFGMGGMGLVLGNEEKDSGIRVSNIYPGEIDTPILAVRPRPVSEEQRASMLKPEDIADAVGYVAGLPKHVSVPELIIKPTNQLYW